MKSLMGIVVFTCIICSGCSTVNVPANVASPIALNLIHSKKLTTLNPNSGHIIVVRDKGFLGEGCDFDVYLDTTLVATLSQPGTKVDMYPSPGNYVLSVSNVTAMCPNQRSGVTVSVERGHLYIYDLSQFSNGSLQLYPSAN